MLTRALTVFFGLVSLASQADAAGGPRFRFSSYPQPVENQYVLADAVSQESRVFGFDSTHTMDCKLGNVLIADGSGRATRCAAASHGGYTHSPSFALCSDVVREMQLEESAARASLGEGTFNQIEARSGSTFASFVPQRVVSTNPARHEATFAVPAGTPEGERREFSMPRLDVYGFYSHVLTSVDERSPANYCIGNEVSEGTVYVLGLAPGEHVLGVIRSVTYATAAVAHLTDVRISNFFDGEAGGLSSIGLAIRNPLNFRESDEGPFTSSMHLFNFAFNTDRGAVPLWVDIAPVHTD